MSQTVEQLDPYKDIQSEFQDKAEAYKQAKNLLTGNLSSKGYTETAEYIEAVADGFLDAANKYHEALIEKKPVPTEGGFFINANIKQVEKMTGYLIEQNEKVGLLTDNFDKKTLTGKERRIFQQIEQTEYKLIDSIRAINVETSNITFFKHMEPPALSHIDKIKLYPKKAVDLFAAANKNCVETLNILHEELNARGYENLATELDGATIKYIEKLALNNTANSENAQPIVKNAQTLEKFYRTVKIYSLNKFPIFHHITLKLRRTVKL